MTGKHTRAEVLLELGEVIARLRTKREEIRAEGEPPNAKLDARIERLQTGYEFITENWPPA